MVVPLWLVMAAVAALALTRGQARPWHRNGAAMVLCMIGCAVLAFIPPAYYSGISTTRHMVGMNIATSLAFVVTAALAVSLIHQAVTRDRSRPPGNGTWTQKVPAVSPCTDDNVGSLDHRYHLTALRQAQLAGGLDGDGGDQPDAVGVQDHVGGGLARRDPGDRRPDLVTRAELHRGSPFMIMTTGLTGYLPRAPSPKPAPSWQAREHGTSAGPTGRERGLPGRARPRHSAGHREDADRCLRVPRRRVPLAFRRRRGYRVVLLEPDSGLAASAGPPATR